MADTKITSLQPPQVVTNPATDVLPIVNIADPLMATSGSTRKITVNQLLGAGGTATLASATITGDLTCSSNVNIGASPVFYGGKIATNGSVAISGGNYLKLWNSTGTGVAGINAGAADTLTFSLTNAFTTAMTLNATGLGVGDAPTASTRLTVAAASRLADTTGQVYIRTTDSYAQDLGAQLTLGGLYNASANYAFGGIAGRKENGTINNVAGYLDFLTTTSAGALTSRMRIDSTGNVGISVVPSAWGTVYKAVDIGLTSLWAQISSGYGTFVSTNLYFDGTNFKYKSNGAAAYYLQASDSTHSWAIAAGGVPAGTTFTPVTAMKLDASGRLLLGKTSSSTASTGAELQTGAGGNSASVFTADGAFASIMNRLTSDGIVVDLRRQTTSVGNITVTTTGATFNSTSDYRLKEAVAPLSGGLARVNALKPSIYKWKCDGSAGEGFVAHELADVVPAAVSGEKDAVNADGSIKAQSIDMSRVVPILVAAIQELTDRVQTLETR